MIIIYAGMKSVNNQQIEGLSSLSYNNNENTKGCRRRRDIAKPRKHYSSLFFCMFQRNSVTHKSCTTMWCSI